MTERKILVYAGTDGSDWRGRHSQNVRNSLKKEYKEKGYIGYLSGYHYTLEDVASVLAFFKEKPTPAEIQRRRNNGFKMAKWNWL